MYIFDNLFYDGTHYQTLAKALTHQTIILYIMTIVNVNSYTPRVDESRLESRSQYQI